MKKYSPTTNLVIFLAALSIVAFIGAYLFFNQIQSKDQYISDINGRIAVEGAQADQLQDLKDIVNTTASSRQELDSAILGSDQFVPFIESIEEIGKSTGVTMTDSLSTVADTASTINTEFLLVDVQMEGSWDQIMKTISLIDTVPYAAITDQLVLNKNTSETAKRPVWDARLELRVMKNK